MVTHPANMVMTIVPRAVAAISGFERIQAFLVQQSLEAHRGILSGSLALNEQSNSWGLPSDHLSTSHAIDVRHLRIGHSQVVLDDINLQVPAGSFVILSGPTGSGKSTMLRAILGEISTAHGSISVSSRKIAYCAQRPWLPNGTIKEVIYGATDIYTSESETHFRWYQEVINMCCLGHDFDALPHGDRTEIGSRGLNLSGGQRQRVVSWTPLF